MKSRWLLLCVSSALCLTGCTKGQIVGRHEFILPKENLITDVPFFLPKPTNTIMILINPREDLRRHKTAVLEEENQMCPTGVTAGPNPTATSCSEQSLISSSAKIFPKEKITKHYEIGDAIWSYRYFDGKTNHIIAGCSKMSVGKGGLCYAMSRYKDLLFRFNFDEDNVQNLPLIAKSIDKQLRTWEVT